MRWMLPTGARDVERFMLATEYRSIMGGLFRLLELGLLVAILVHVA